MWRFLVKHYLLMLIVDLGNANRHFCAERSLGVFNELIELHDPRFVFLDINSCPCSEMHEKKQNVFKIS
jgi:hypothetical protein